MTSQFRLTLFFVFFSLQIFAQNLEEILQKTNLDEVHSGIIIKDLTENKILHTHNEKFYFMPASTQKVITYYLSHKYLPEKLPAFKWKESGDTLYIAGTGDPSFLHTKFQNRALIEFVRNRKVKIVALVDPLIEKKYPKGWAWEDFPYYYMTELSEFPIFGNVINVHSNRKNFQLIPDYFKHFTFWKDGLKEPLRDYSKNVFYVPYNKWTVGEDVPFILSEPVLEDLFSIQLNKKLIIVPKQNTRTWETVSYQATDSLYRKMLHDSDNMIAEQLLLSIGNRQSWPMETETIIEKLQAENSFLSQIDWVDGSGLSRYNLVRPVDMIQVLDKIQAEIPAKNWQDEMARMGEEYKAWENVQVPGKMWAKTGSFSNTFNLVGFYQKDNGHLYSFVFFTNLSRIKPSELRRRIGLTLNMLF